jgi:5'-nucleotidase
MRRLPLVALIVLLCGIWPAGAQAPKTYRILVTNDDGVRAAGLAALVAALAPLGELTIVAPLEDQSAISHALTMNDPIYADSITLADGRMATGVAATTATCVRLALGRLLVAPPDLVVSGVNRGSNFGLNAYISATVAGAREAAMHGIPAISASLDIAGHPNYGPAAAATARVAAIVKEGGLPRGIFLNVNVPAGVLAAGKGLKLARQSRAMGTQQFEESRTPSGRRLFWSVFRQPTTAEPGTDVQAALDGFVAVTPLRASEFDAAAFDVLGKRFP